MNTLPKHLSRYVVDQNYARYTAEDQAVWRFIMRQLREYLSVHAHECYLDGLTRTGLHTESIPQISVMDQNLQKFGWRAVPVSGFIPPAAFMEFQSLGFLPIASDMRSIEHILYTPAPDIVHEAAGHAPILIDPQFSDYLKKYATVARCAILSRQDLDQYEAIRELSDIKEHPQSTSQQIIAAEKKLSEINKAIHFTSEGSLISRMNWWTAEYGLVGNLSRPRIFGAGLLSSLGESRSCLAPSVKKIPLTVECINYSYDITEPQPQLFVAEKFSDLHNVLNQMSERLAFKRGGDYGLHVALQAETVNTIVLDSGLQISGVLSKVHKDHLGSPCYLQWTGPCQLAYRDEQLPGHGALTHPHGFGTPIGEGPGIEGLALGRDHTLLFTSGIQVKGRLESRIEREGHTVVARFSACTVNRGDEILFQPEWGYFDMGIGRSVVSVFGGPADRGEFPQERDFVNSRVPDREFSADEKRRHGLYEQLRNWRLNELQSSGLAAKLKQICQKYLAEYPDQWLIGIELLEWTYQLAELQSERSRLLENLKTRHTTQTQIQYCVDLGVKLASHGF